MTNYTIVTGFFDIGRDLWDYSSRDKSKYFDFGKRLLTLDDNMIIFIDEKYNDFVLEYRKGKLEKTIIKNIRLKDLPYFRYYTKINDIMNSNEFKTGIIEPDRPEMTKPEYNILIWSKIFLINEAIKNNNFNSTHFIWIDFGITNKILLNKYLNTKLFKKKHIPDKIKIMCRSMPQNDDLNIDNFYKSHINRFAATVFSGNIDSFIKFQEYFDKEVINCFEKKLVDCEQSLYSIIYLKHPELFELYFGDWLDLITKY